MQLPKPEELEEELEELEEDEETHWNVQESRQGGTFIKQGGQIDWQL